MNKPVQPRLALHLGALCCALLWGFSAAQAPRAANPAAAPSPEVPAIRTECPSGGGKPLARTELFFGLARSDGSTVSAEEFQRFVDQEITPRFPAGLTLLGGNGQFRHADGTLVKEDAKVLILLYPNDGASHRNIEFVRAAYAKAFAQESVLRVDGGSCVS